MNKVDLACTARKWKYRKHRDSIRVGIGFIFSILHCIPFTDMSVENREMANGVRLRTAFGQGW